MAQSSRWMAVSTESAMQQSTSTEIEPDNGHCPPLAYTIENAAQATGVSRALLYEALRDKELTARKVHSRTLIERTELARWLQSRPTIGRQPKQP